MDREKSVRRPFGFVSFSSEKTAEEVLRQQRHSVNGASIEVRPAKPRPHEQQQQLQMQQQYQYGEYILPHHHPHNTLISSISAPTMTHQSIINIHPNQNSYYTHNNNNYAGQVKFIYLKFLKRNSSFFYLD
jgi:RNA recognition motif-containing protein